MSFTDGDKFHVTDHTDGDFIMTRTDGRWPCRCGQTHDDEQVQVDLANGNGRLIPTKAGIHSDRDRSEPRERQNQIEHPMHEDGAVAVRPTGEKTAGGSAAAATLHDGSGTSRVVVARGGDDERGNRRGPDGYLCCKHCADDNVHDVEPDGHDGPCQTCDDPGAMLRERNAALVADNEALRAEVDDLSTRLSALLCDLTRGRLSKTNYDVRTMVQAVEEAFEEDAAETERALADAQAKVARVEALLNEAGRGMFFRSDSVLVAVVRAALAGPEPATTEGGDDRG